jgi:hypothetical protein
MGCITPSACIINIDKRALGSISRRIVELAGLLVRQSHAVDQIVASALALGPFLVSSRVEVIIRLTSVYGPGIAVSRLWKLGVSIRLVEAALGSRQAQSICRNESEKDDNK